MDSWMEGWANEWARRIALKLKNIYRNMRVPFQIHLSKDNINTAIKKNCENFDGTFLRNRGRRLLNNT